MTSSAWVGCCWRCVTAATTTVSPEWDYPVLPGTQLFYIATRRLASRELEAALPGE